MTIYEFATAINDCENIIFKIFDCNTEDCVFIQTYDTDGKLEVNIDELLDSKYSDYEIGGIDMWIQDRKIHIEFNIEIEEDD